jgi:hypothetical protein
MAWEKMYNLFFLLSNFFAFGPIDLKKNLLFFKRQTRFPSAISGQEVSEEIAETNIVKTIV